MPPKRRVKKEEHGGATSPSTLPAAGELSAPSAFPSTPLQTAEAEGGATTRSASTAISAQGGRHIKLNVGGVRYVTSRETLLACESKLALWTRNGFDGMPRSPDGSVFINRDGKIFRHILNYLRGYEIHVPQEDIQLLAEDAAYFDVAQMMKEVGLAPPDEWRFLPGPGVKDGVQFSTCTLVGVVGDTFRSTGVMTASWKVDKHEMVAIGAVTEASADDMSTPIKHAPWATCYISTGEVFCNWDSATLQQHTQRPAAEYRYRENDIVGIKLDYLSANVADAAERRLVVTYFKNDVPVQILSLRPSADGALPAYRPAVFVEGVSVVHLIDVSIRDESAQGPSQGEELRFSSLVSRTDNESQSPTPVLAPNLFQAVG